MAGHAIAVNERNNAVSFTSTLYALARLGRDINAVRRGPRAVAKRQARKVLYRVAAKAINRMVRP